MLQFRNVENKSLKFFAMGKSIASTCLLSGIFSHILGCGISLSDLVNAGIASKIRVDIALKV